MNIDVVLSAKAIQQINYLNKVHKGLEWLAYIAYKPTSISKDYVRMDVEGLFPLDFGSSVYTETVKTSQLEITEVYYPDCEIGGIHSHHTMDTGFSHTDMKELSDNYSNYVKGYLSVIVNYAMHNRAKFATTVKTVTPAMSLQKNIWSFVERMFVTETKVIPEKTEETLQITDCEVFNEYTALYRDSTVDTWFANKVTELTEEKKKAAKSKTKYVKPSKHSHTSSLVCSNCGSQPFFRDGRHYCYVCGDFTTVEKETQYVAPSKMNVPKSRITPSQADIILYRLFKGVPYRGSFKQLVKTPTTIYTQPCLELSNVLACVKSVTAVATIDQFAIEDILDELYETALESVEKTKKFDLFIHHLYNLLDEEGAMQ